MKKESKKFSYDFSAIREYALRSVTDSAVKISPSTLEKKLVDIYGLHKKQIRSVIRDLVVAGELTYTYQYGNSYLEPSFAKPVRISEHIILKPPGIRYRAEPNDVVVDIQPGTSFGAGNHPTTRLAIKGIEYVLLGRQVVDNKQGRNVLDIGTGSGVLLITAILCGMQTGLGLDIDACALAEAAENTKINCLEDRVAISDQSLADIRQRFSLILANLRYPSLMKMQPQINERTDTNSFLIFSGIRHHELNDLVRFYERSPFKTIWAEDELGWSGVVLRKIHDSISH